MTCLSLTAVTEARSCWVRPPFDTVQTTEEPTVAGSESGQETWFDLAEGAAIDVITGPAALFAGIAAMELGDHATARDAVAAAEKLATSLGWTPWIDAARRVGAVLDGDDVDLPLGTGPRGMGKGDG